MQTLASIVAVITAVCLVGCSSTSKASKSARPMGERIQLGPLAYTVYEADWLNDLGDGSNLRTPKNRFLVVRLSIENVGNREATVPLLMVENEAAQDLLELDNGQGVAAWLGLLRQIPPGDRIEGRIVFDVPMGAYNLRLTDGGEPDKERVGYVHLPVKLGEVATPEAR